MTAAQTQPFHRRASRRAIFLDRDGTLNVDTRYPAQAESVRLLDGAAQGAQRLAGAGYALVIVSNQSGIARGLFTEEQADAVDAQVAALLRSAGAPIEASYRCPHLPEGSVERYAIHCGCRKPKPGLLFHAAAQLGVDLDRSWVVGDSQRDVDAGLVVGCSAVLLTSDESGEPKGPGIRRAPNLLAAAELILKSS